MKSSDITILLTLFNRDCFTRSFLEEYASSNSTMPLLVADSSETDSNQGIVTSFIDDHPELRIRYIKYKADTSYNTMLEKFLDALDKVETKYCMFADNDDFLFYKNIEEAENNLKDGISMISGRVYLERCLGKLCFHFRVPDKSIEEERPDKRLQDHSLNYTELWYSISATNIKKEIIKKYAHVGISDINMLYPFFSFEHLWLGDYKLIRENFLIRKISDTSVQSSLKNQRMRVLLNPEFIDQLDEYVNIFTKNKDVVRSDIVNMFSEIYDQRYFNKYVSLFLKSPTRVLNFLKRRVNISKVTFRQKTPLEARKD